MVIDRRSVLAVFAALLAGPAAAQTADAGTSEAGAAGGMTRVTAYAFSFAGLRGGQIRLIEHAGKPILIVNTASRCGYTPQYAGLQDLWTRYRERGLLVVGVPSNDFGNQEPGGADDIARTANEAFGATFPLAAKAEVRGANPHPFYKWAAFERPFEVPSWNFHKYLIGRDGHVVATFPAEVEPTDPRVVAAIERALGAE
jgi:glutathione peroxidase